MPSSEKAHLERLKPAKPEWEASSMSGVTIRSIMSVSTVKVGTTMKSMNPEDTSISNNNVSTSVLTRPSRLGRKDDQTNHW